MRLLMKVGALVIVIENFPDWDWLRYKTGQVGIIKNIRRGFDRSLMLDVYFFETMRVEPIPSYYVEILEEHL